MKARLFPASTDQPTTAFSFGVLKDFHLQTLELKKSAYDYLGGLTNNANPDGVPNPYAQFLRVVRVWRMLMMHQRSGQAHGIDTFFPHRPKGNMAVSCPTCLEPGVNMEEGWDLTDEDLKHIIQLYKSINGNFQLQKKKKNDDPDDVALMEGLGYFPPDLGYQEYLKRVGESKECTCAHLNAVNMQDKIKFKNCDITGVVGIECRHILIMSMVDLQKGERCALHVLHSELFTNI
ncbi:hypothetical protein PILCRDRAFT_81407 [Piloderma croceum F 1598]|uniref:CxC2-like cysteine cluster KDZ transposase-associated domain-containing protein n=1 Tax=Piloderma croceum (strain F 1598) TaxID=765440 RepID=A0A0C3B1X0_PILCF|nr:hypothetical protein PILCRDRAFT_82994 [Piloderma croceum F 1598]KIM73067.1 hypothetical protein PILCRDRAFT_81407 [Piloderma croceum F 1598]